MSKDATCPGCGGPTAGYPYFLLARSDDGKAWTARDVCARCHQVPTSRATPLKGHFFHESQRERALAMAGSDTIGG